MEPNDAIASDFQDHPVRELWLVGASLEQALAWAEAARPFLADRAVGDVEVRINRTARGLVLRCGPDEGYLHAVAIEAERAQVASLTLDGSFFECPTGFYALTVRRPGHGRETSWFDPLRGLTADAPRMTEWVESFRGEPTTIENFFLWKLPFSDETIVGTVTVQRAGPVRFEPFVPWQDDTSGFERLMNALAWIAPVAVTWFVASLTSSPGSLSMAMGPAVLAIVLTGILTFAPLVLPNGATPPWFLRVAWFFFAPLGFAALRYRLMRGTW